jgi:hypothetical protein
MPAPKEHRVNLMRRLGRSCHFNLPAKKWTGERKVESMKPVMTALHAIATIERETRDAHAEAAATCPTETILSQDANGRHGQDAPSAYREATAHLNRGPGAPPIDHVEATAPEAAFAWDGKIRIDKRDRVVGAPARNATTIITGALLSALALCIGWIGGLNSDSFTLKPASLPVETINSSAEDRPDAAKSERLASANAIATGTNSAHETSKRGAQTTDSLLTKQATKAPQPTTVERTKVSTKPAPVPETRPTTIEGWTIREVSGGTAVLEGPNGVWKAARGDTVPGVGKIDSIVRWGNRWIVATSRGLISTR